MGVAGVVEMPPGGVSPLAPSPTAPTSVGGLAIIVPGGGGPGLVTAPGPGVLGLPTCVLFASLVASEPAATRAALAAPVDDGP